MAWFAVACVLNLAVQELAKAGQAWKDDFVTRPLSYAVSEPEIQMPKRTAALKARLVGASKLVEELIKRGIRLVIFDFDGVMYREHGECRHIKYIYTFLFYIHVYLLCTYVSFLCSHSFFWQRV